MFTFKKGEKNTGLAAVGNPYPETYIKNKKEIVGTILPPSTVSAKWRVGLTVKERATKECPWGWVFFNC